MKKEQKTAEDALKWTVTERRPLLHTAVFDVLAQKEHAPNGISGEYVALQAPDWVMTVAVYENQFVTVTQWRHGEERLTTEFPGGVVEPGEDPAEAAKRELLEETGFRVGKLTHLGTCSPNPALSKNHFHCYLAEGLTPTGTQQTDPDELLRVRLLPIEQVLSSYGDGSFTHALMGAALAFYLLHQRRQGE